MVWVIGKSRELGEHSTPIVGIGEDGERVGVAPLTVLDEPKGRGGAFRGLLGHRYDGRARSPIRRSTLV